jgi:hypothetical protein
MSKKLRAGNHCLYLNSPPPWWLASDRTLPPAALTWRLPRDLRKLIREMAADNPIWGEERIANEVKLKLGIRVSPRTVGKYLRDGTVRAPDPQAALGDLCP